MIDKILKWATPVLLLVLVAKVFVGGGGFALRGTTDDTTGFGSLDLSGDLEIDGVVAIDAARGISAASGTFTNIKVGSGNSISTNINCTSVQFDSPNIVPNGTTSVDVSLTGVLSTGSSTQVYWAGIATSTGEVRIVGVSASTTNVLNVYLKNNASGTGAAVNLANTQLTACYLGGTF